MILQQFINAGWYTVPLGGQLKRTDSGGKTIPKFETNWNKVYTKKFNERATPLGGAMTGKVSGIIAIDCDTDQTYQIFRALDPDYKFIFPSKGKPDGGGTIVYKYDNRVPTLKMEKKDGFALDVFTDEGFIYLPTENNHTKEAWPYSELPDLKEIPPNMLSLLLRLKPNKHTITPDTAKRSPLVAHRLAPMVKAFVDMQTEEDKYSVQLFKIITPRAFRDIPSYLAKQHLHPNDVPEGRGSEYLASISWILGADPSINHDLYFKAMHAINKLWDKPLDIDRLNQTILNPMIEKRSVRPEDGSVVWQYDPHWKKNGLTTTSKRGDYIEAFFDDYVGWYYLVNHTADWHRRYKSSSAIREQVSNITGQAISAAQFGTLTSLVKTITDPSIEFGHTKNKEFNLFRQSKYLDIINYPETYAENYKKPEATLQYLETLMPDEVMRNYVISFMRTKLTTFKYSPVILYFLGVGGSGKDTFVELMSTIIGREYVAVPKANVFIQPQNGWVMDSYIAHIDEYSKQAVTFRDNELVMGQLKTISGSEIMQLREMHMDGVNYKHGITFIVTDNRNKLPIETGDRRFAMISTPNILREAEWVKEAGDISEIIDKIRSELPDLCYYLATEINNLSGGDYQTPPSTVNKDDVITNTMPARELIAHYMKTEKFESLAELFNVNNITEPYDGWAKGRIFVDKLLQLYDCLTDGKGTASALKDAIKAQGILMGKTSSSSNGTVTNNRQYYKMEGVRNFEPKFEPQDP